MNAAAARKEVLWSAEEAVQATGGRTTCDWQATGVSIDSRSVEAGDLFVALKGPSFDGHDFAGKAIKAGAAASMVHRRADGVDESMPLLIVDDTFAALWRLGTAARERSQARLIAVTGSVGKTGTKEALRLCLTPQGLTSASIGSFNNHWGVPLSLARMERQAVYGVFELGMNNPGEIRELTALVRPHVAIITNIEPAHIGNFNSITDIADAKAEIFEGMDANGTAVLNRDNALFHHLCTKAEDAGITRIASFGRHKEADARVLDCSLHHARRFRGARPRHGGKGRAAHRRAGRHAGARRALRRNAQRPRRPAGSGRDRPRLHLRRRHGRAAREAAEETARRARGRLQGAGAQGRRGGKARRQPAGEGVARQPHGGHRRSPARARQREGPQSGERTVGTG